MNEIRLARPDVGEREVEAMREVLESGQLTMGPKVEEFECAIADAVGTAHAAAVSSGTAALHLAVLALGIGPGDEVIVPAYTFPATANAVELCGGRTVLVDVDPDTFLVDPAGVAAALTSRTRAVMAVHLFGRPVDWQALRDVVPEDVLLIEDAAGALGASHQGVPCGALGVLACFSFHPRKIVTTGEGGAVTTDDAELDSAIRRLRHHGWAEIGEMPTPGFNYRLPGTSCARSGFRRSRSSRSCSRRASALRDSTRSDWATLLTPRAAEGDRHGWQAYVVQLERRDDALAALRAEGIEAQIGTWALHRLEPYRVQGPFPGADSAFERALALPFHTQLTEADLDRVAHVLTEL